MELIVETGGPGWAPSPSHKAVHCMVMPSLLWLPKATRHQAHGLVNPSQVNDCPKGGTSPLLNS